VRFLLVLTEAKKNVTFPQRTSCQAMDVRKAQSSCNAGTAAAPVWRIEPETLVKPSIFRFVIGCVVSLFVGITRVVHRFPFLVFVAAVTNTAECAQASQVVVIGSDLVVRGASALQCAPDRPRSDNDRVVKLVRGAISRSCSYSFA
jgi:hypothetical protein